MMVCFETSEMVEYTSNKVVEVETALSFYMAGIFILALPVNSVDHDFRALTGLKGLIWL